MRADEMLLSEPTMRQTLVCRADGCGGGWWGDVPGPLCPKCGKRLTELALTRVVAL